MPIQKCSIVVNYENKSILIEAGNKAISPLLFDSILDVSANTIRWKKDVKYLKIGKKRENDHHLQMIWLLYMENPSVLTGNY